MEHVLKPISLPRLTTLTFSPSSPFAHHHGAPETRLSASLRLGLQAGASDGRGIPACCPGLMQPLRTYRSKAFAIGSIVSSQIKYIVEETVKLYQEKKLMNILACQKIQQNAKSTEMNEHAHSGFLPRLRKLSASNHARGVFGVPLLVSHHVTDWQSSPSAMGENSNGAVEEDKSETQDKMVFSFQERVKSNGPLIALLILALIFGTRHRISRMIKAAGLDTKRSVILLYSCICVVKSVYGALKEAKDVGELIMFYMNVSKKENKSSEK
ncbi:hypothetical protein HU200_057773 [Digitaria exilis]|uniref:Uncharacterized protein n=1 Tax=Digitaria exilis TaxID=1010633 RepID=A0A835AAI0_9POAL|nr:hypothetical protein HU200_057773 [Digitaria exilis]